MSVAACLLAVQWVHALGGLGGAATDNFFGSWMYDGIEATAGVVLIWRGLQRRGSHRAWLVLGVGLLSKAVGDVIYSLAPDPGAVPVPSVSDGFWLAFYPCAYVSLVLLVKGRVANTRASGMSPELWLDASRYPRSAASHATMAAPSTPRVRSTRQPDSAIALTTPPISTRSPIG
jgi:hypothetical protein